MIYPHKTQGLLKWTKGFLCTKSRSVKLVNHTIWKCEKNMRYNCLKMGRMQKRNFSVVSSMTFKQPFRFSWFPILQDFDQVDQIIHCKDPVMSKVYYIYSTYKNKVAKIFSPWYTTFHKWIMISNIESVSNIQTIFGRTIIRYAV